MTEHTPMGPSDSWPEDCRTLKDIGIRDGMTDGAVGCDARWLIGRKVVAVVEIPDSDGDESLILCSDGFVVGVSCDLGYADDDGTRTLDRSEVCFYDCTDRSAGEHMRSHFSELLDLERTEAGE